MFLTSLCIVRVWGCFFFSIFFGVFKTIMSLMNKDSIISFFPIYMPFISPSLSVKTLSNVE